MNRFASTTDRNLRIFIMPMNLLVNGLEQRVFPGQEFQSFDISKHATIEVMDWKFYVKKKKNYQNK